MYLSDYNARKILREWKQKCFGKYRMRYIFGYTFNDGILTIFSNYPGILIGKAGTTINEYSGKLKESCTDIKEVHIKELMTVYEDKMRVRYMNKAQAKAHNLSQYPNFSATGSIKGMKEKYYGKDVLLVRSGSWIYKVPESVYYCAH